MNYPAAMFYLTLVMTVVNIIISLSVWWNNREKVSNKRFETLERDVAKRITRADLDAAIVARDGKCDTHKRETKTLEQSYNALHNEVSKLPNRAEVKDLADSMRGLTEKIGNLDGRMSGMNRAVDLINEFLIDQGGKK